MTTYASDSCTRANSTTSPGSADVGGAYTVDGGTWGINNNKLYIVTGSGHSHAYLSVGQSAVHVSCDITLSGTSALASLTLRHTDAGNRVAVWLSNCSGVGNTIQIAQQLGGSFSDLGTIAGGLTLGQTYALKCIVTGNTVDVYLDGVQKFGPSPTAFDSSLTAQNYGVHCYYGGSFEDGGSRWDNLLITDGITATPPPRPIVMRT